MPDIPCTSAVNAGRRVLALALALLAAACAAPSYYVQAVSGHYSLMNQREDIDALLSRQGTDTELASRLELAGEMREFGVRVLGLEDSGAYRQYVATGRDAVAWNVVATPEFSLAPKRWCFLVSGCVPYRGYFDRDDAERFARKLAAQGYDIALSPATAYSTLGWFDDPLFDTMFRHGNTELAAVLFHEMAHQKLYVKGDAAFSEAFATFVEGVGVERWIRAHGTPGSLEQWRQKEAASLQFNAFLRQQRGLLEKIYAKEQDEAELRLEKQAFFGRFRQAYQAMVEEAWNGRDYYGGWVVGELNNAHLALVSTYQGGACAFSNLYRTAGENMERFMQLSAQTAALSRDDRDHWLRQACSAVAPGGDL